MPNVTLHTSTLLLLTHHTRTTRLLTLHTRTTLLLTLHTHVDAHADGGGDAVVGDAEVGASVRPLHAGELQGRTLHVRPWRHTTGHRQQDLRCTHYARQALKTDNRASSAGPTVHPLCTSGPDDRQQGIVVCTRCTFYRPTADILSGSTHTVRRHAYCPKAHILSDSKHTARQHTYCQTAHIVSDSTHLFWKDTASNSTQCPTAHINCLTAHINYNYSWQITTHYHTARGQHHTCTNTSLKFWKPVLQTWSPARTRSTDKPVVQNTWTRSMDKPVVQNTWTRSMNKPVV